MAHNNNAGAAAAAAAAAGCSIVTAIPRMLGEGGRWPYRMKKGYYIFFNHRVSDATCQDVGEGIARVKALFRQKNVKDKIVYVANNHEDWTFASNQVRQAGDHEHYPCGEAMPPTFFDDDKMKYTVNMIILYCDKRQQPGRRGRQSRYATYAFVVIRDLLRVEAIFEKIEQVKGREGSAGSEYFDSLMDDGSPSQLHEEPCLYIEGLCAGKEAGRGRGTKLMDLVHLLAFYSSGGCYAGCKLSALTYVIQYYFNKFSYRFRKSCQGDGTNADCNHADLLRINNTVNTLPRISSDEEVEEEAETQLKGPWQDFVEMLGANGFNSEVTRDTAARLSSFRNYMVYHDDDNNNQQQQNNNNNQSNSQSNSQSNQEDADDFSTTRKAKLWERLKVLDQGFKMYFCFANNPTLEIYQGNLTPFTQLIGYEAAAARAAAAGRPMPPLYKKPLSPVKPTKNPFSQLANNSGGRRTRRQRRTQKKRKRRRRRTRKRRGGRRKTRRQRRKRRRTRKRRN